MEQQKVAIILSNEEVDRLLEKLDLLRGDEDVEYLKQKIYSQQTYSPSDAPTLPITSILSSAGENRLSQRNVRVVNK